MTIGPVEYIVVGFPGNKFRGEIAPALAKLVDDGLIRILDLVFIGKDDDGTIVTFEIDEVEGSESFTIIDGDISGIIGQDDIAHAATALAPGNSAALMLWEDLWAIPFVEAVQDTEGVLLEGGRIPRELIEAALAALPPEN
jgi:Family of unknown function (DUF6325)